MENFKELIKKRGIGEATQKVYAKRLEELLDNLNDKNHDRLDILKDTDKVFAYINKFKFGKKKSFVNACMAGLSPESNLPVHLCGEKVESLVPHASKHRKRRTARTMCLELSSTRSWSDKLARSR